MRLAVCVEGSLYMCRSRGGEAFVVPWGPQGASNLVENQINLAWHGRAEEGRGSCGPSSAIIALLFRLSFIYALAYVSLGV